MFLGDVVQVHLKQGTGTGCGEFFPGTHLGATVKADRYMNICVGPCPDADSDEDRNAVPDTTFAVGASSSAPGQVPIEDLNTVLAILQKSIAGAK